MATLNLTALWINRLDTGAAISAQTAVGKPLDHDTDGEVRQYAGGRQRAVLAVGESTTWQPTLVGVTLATKDLLRTWVGVPVQVRDWRGQRYVCVFFRVPVDEEREPNLYDVTLTLRLVTVDEES